MFVYLLHFDNLLSHAEHYAGSTDNIRQRLIAHASSRGARLTEAVGQVGINWRLAYLGTVTRGTAKKVERALKDQHNLPRYCPLCNPGCPKVPGTTPYPLESLPFTPSAAALAGRQEQDDIACRLISPGEETTVMPFVLKLMRNDKDALGFIPAGGKEGLQYLVEKRQIALVSNNGEDVGYAAFTVSADRSRLSIQQTCVRDDARHLKHGSALVSFVVASRPLAAVWAKVREDLPAIFFWQAIGFEAIRKTTHKTSRSTLLNFYKEPMIGSRKEESHDTV